MAASSTILATPSSTGTGVESRLVGQHTDSLQSRDSWVLTVHLLGEMGLLSNLPDSAAHHTGVSQDSDTNQLLWSADTRVPIDVAQTLAESQKPHASASQTNTAASDPFWIEAGGDDFWNGST